MGGSSSSDGTTKYAKYVESRHKNFLEKINRYASGDDGYRYWMELDPRYDEFWGAYIEKSSYDPLLITSGICDASPFDSYTNVEIDNAFFGSGYVIANFPALFDTYGKFLAGLDIDSLYRSIFEDTVDSPEAEELIEAEAAMMDEDVNTSILPQFQTSMRDINAVVSSSFIIGKAAIEDARLKSLTKFSSRVKQALIPGAMERWKQNLEWNEHTVSLYSEIMKFYFSAKMDIDEVNYSFAAKNRLWPFTVFEYERAAIGTLQGSYAPTGIAGASQTQKTLSGALTGAAAGVQATGGSGWGALLGAAAGVGASFA